MQPVMIKDVEIMVGADESYIQINDIGLKEVGEVWDELAKSYAGYTADFCFHNTVAPEAFLKEKGAVLLDNCIEAWLAPKDFVELASENFDIREINQDNFSAFAPIHDEKNPDMYWNSERIFKGLPVWDIFAIFSDGAISDYMLLRNGWDIYCVQAESLENKIALMASCAKKTFGKGNKEILFMVDRDNHLELGAALHLGFRRKGYYISYRMKF